VQRNVISFAGILISLPVYFVNVLIFWLKHRKFDGDGQKNKNLFTGNLLHHEQFSTLPGLRGEIVKHFSTGRFNGLFF